MEIETGILTLKAADRAQPFECSFVYISKLQFQQACRDSLLELFRTWNDLDLEGKGMSINIELRGKKNGKDVTPSYEVRFGDRSVLGSKLYKMLAVDLVSFIQGVEYA